LPEPEGFLPYGRQTIDDDDVAAVVAALRSDWLTTGPRVEEFEAAFATVTGAAHAVAVSSGTAALHASYHALGLGPGDEVIVPPLTFAATANAVLYAGATPVFADVDPATLLLDPDAVAAAIGPRTRAIAAVDYAGQPCDYAALRALAGEHGLALVADACHSLGGADAGRPVGTLADLSAFSLHPVKQVTTGEGGVVTTADPELAARLRRFRNHGIDSDHRARAAAGSWFYEQVELGFNYRITDVQCALGTSQLRKLGGWIERRRALAARYDELLAGVPGVEPLATRPGAEHAYHLYVVRLEADREAVFRQLRTAGIGANVHYVPVHLHPYHRRRLGTGPGLCPVAEAAYERILSLPLFPAMADEDVDRVVRELERATWLAVAA
jgi:UDP-4-amino-4,6-dideoxy-N-acetyl-beta-L-altrosamine transaminase